MQAYYIANGANILLAVIQTLSFFQVNYNLSMLTGIVVLDRLIVRLQCAFFMEMPLFCRHVKV